MEALALVDVDSESPEETWSLLLDAIRNAHFTALDLELSGLGDVIGRGKGHTIDTRYSDACEAVKTRAMLSLGVACFQWKQLSESSQREDTQSQLVSHTTEPSAAAVAAVATSQTAPDSVTVQEETTPAGTDVTQTPEAGITKTLAAGQEGTGSLAVGVEVQVFNMWLMCQRPYTIDPSSARFLVQHGFDFNRQFARGIPYTPGPLEVGEDDEKKVSLQHLLATILAVGKPVVVHNGWIDLLFLYGNLYSPLPPSLGTLLADMSEMFVGGVYDTKAIAQYEVPQEATFLEYLFRKCQRDNEVLTSRGSPHIELCQPSLPSSVPTEMVPLTPPPPLSLEEMAEITVCQTFSRYGFCHKTSCPHSHNVLTVLTQHEHQLKLRQLRRKRKRKNEQKQAGVDNGASCPTSSKQHCSTSKDSPTAATHPLAEEQLSLAKQFASELAAARRKLASLSQAKEPPNLSEISPVELSTHPTSTSVSATSPPSSTSPTSALSKTSPHVQPSGKYSNKSTDQRPSYGHRAGFDAFMTGYVFASLALTQTTHKTLSAASGAPKFDEAVIAGLSSMRNRLSNRNKPVPLILAKSQFEKTSPSHRENCDKISRLRKSLYWPSSSSSYKIS